MNQLFKVGDVITVRSKYIEGTNGGDYPFLFIPGMKNDYGGCKFKIKTCEHNDSYKGRRMFLDPFLYTLETLEGISLYEWSWCSAMFVESDVYINQKPTIF